MPVHKAEALFDFQPTAAVELQLKVLSVQTPTQRRDWRLRPRRVVLCVLHSLGEHWWGEDARLTRLQILSVGMNDLLCSLQWTIACCNPIYDMISKQLVQRWDGCVLYVETIACPAYCTDAVSVVECVLWLDPCCQKPGTEILDIRPV